jgi:hypothetical protein
LYVNILDNIDLKENLTYPLIVNTNNNKTNFEDYNTIQNYSEGEISHILNDNIIIDDIYNKFYIKYNDDYILYSYKLFKELLFTYIKPDDYKFTCDIYSDTTVL